MTPERWQQIETLYHAARARQTPERAAFLAKACADDSGLHAEVEALLRADDVTRGIIDGNVMEQAVGLHSTTAPLQLGQQLGAYKILALLGKGGMGEVYRARDTRLDRDVAIKVLPAALTTDPDRLSRFAIEAKATSALNHPNILTVHDVGQAPPELGGAPYLVAELLEGEELRAPLMQGPLPVRKAIDYAQQIVAGLTAAHAKNIVHRDLKPENLFVTKDGRVKILDFGLAKLKARHTDSAGSDVATQKQLTSPGTVMGTVAYMSPEQVRGEMVDHRSDLFSFGLILFEMLRGERAFQKGTIAETMTAILNEEPPELSETNAKISPPLEKIVRRCLEKKPERRFQSTSDLGFALEALSTPSASGANRTEVVRVLETAATSKYGGWRDRIAWIVAGLFALTALALGVAYFNRPANSVPAVRLSFTPPEKVAFDNGRYDSVVVSPDGQKLVFTGQSADGKRQLYVRPLDSGEATPLLSTEDALAPFWSPDSRSIGFGAQGKLKRLELAGGRPQTLCDAPRLEGGTWNREGIIVFAPNNVGRLYQVPATGGTPAPVTGLEPTQGLLDHRAPYFLPDGRHFLYRDVGAEDQRHVIVASLDSKEVKRILADAAPAVYAPPGWLLFVRDGALVAQPFDATRLELKGEAVPLTSPVESFDRFAVPLSVSENGVLVWRGDPQHDYQLVWFDRTGKQESVLSPTVRNAVGAHPKLAPDGRNVALARVDPKTWNTDIWTIDVQRNLPTRLTFDQASDEWPQWSPDGSQVAFRSRRGGTQGFYQKAAGGGGEDLLLTSGNGALSDWSRDGRYLLYNKISEKTRRDIWALPLFGERQPYLLINSIFDEYQAQLSPDLHWLAWASDESGSYEIYVQPFTADGKLGGDKKRISISGGTQPRFSRNGQELFYVAADGMMMAVPMSGETFATPKALFKTRMLTGLVQSGIDYDVTADGQRFLIGTKVGEPTPVTVFLNWTAGLKK